MKKFGWERRIYLRSRRLKGREEGKKTENIKTSFVRFVITTKEEEEEEIRQRMRMWHKRIFAITPFDFGKRMRKGKQMRYGEGGGIAEIIDCAVS